MSKTPSKKERTRIPIGNIHFGEVNPATILYTLKYMSKPKTITKHDTRNPEFSLMSKGLGLSYLSKQMVHWHKADTENRAYLNFNGGHKTSMPRYYREKIYSTKDKDAISLKRSTDQSTKAARLQIPDLHAYERDKAQAKARAYHKMHNQPKKRKI